MTAKDRFQKGDRVQYSAQWLEVASRGSPQRQMTVIGFGYKPYGVRVRYDGCTTPVSYHMDFLEHVKRTRRRP